MTKLTREEVLKLARLSKLELSDNEIDEFAGEMSSILSYVQQLESVDVKGLTATSQVTGLTNVMRKDEVIDYGATPKELLKNVPDTKNGYIKVKRVL